MTSGKNDNGSAKLVPDVVHNGQLFTGYYLSEGIRETAEFNKITDKEALNFADKSYNLLETHAKGLAATLNEAQTAHNVIFPILGEYLGWEINPQVRTSATDIPDAVLYHSGKKAGGAVILENKKLHTQLDRRQGNSAAPSSQMLRYLRNAENIDWGILTDGALWRLYYRRANSKSEQFLELKPGTLLAPTEERREHWAKVFMLMFGRDSYVPNAAGEVFPQRARNESHEWERKITEELSKKIFKNVFPDLARAFAGDNHSEAHLRDSREAAMILLFRLLFVLYAEDRDLLQLNKNSYRKSALRRLSQDLENYNPDDWSKKGTQYHENFNYYCRVIDKGDSSLNRPPYNGGLFSAERVPLITNNPLSDRDFNSAVAALSYDDDKWINYRDLSVRHLGAIYERFLELELYISGTGQVNVRQNHFALKSSGSYYTPEELVQLVIDGSVGILLKEYKAEFAAAIKNKTPLAKLKKLDPAMRGLQLKVCDPAMGSGHFLVSLVDYLADWALAEMAHAQAEAQNPEYYSPLLDEIENIRDEIRKEAKKGGWQIDERNLDDRQIIRRLVLKRVIYGADKNPMAVELAKLSLWLHTFTIGAPLAFLDHHLRSGDSLFGEFAAGAMKTLDELGKPLLAKPLLEMAQNAAAADMHKIELLTDTNIAEVDKSKETFNEMREKANPFNRVLSFLHCRHWFNAEDGKMQHLNPLTAVESLLQNKKPEGAAAEYIERANKLCERENFIHWETTFPGVWSDWANGKKRSGGFDAIVGNPPWDVMKMQEVEWFAVHMPEVNKAPTAAKRKKIINQLREKGDPIIAMYDTASRRIKNMRTVARKCGEYHLLSSGDINLYSLFVERALALIKPNGVAGLLTPSGIYADKPSSAFFRSVVRSERLITLIDIINQPHAFFRDVMGAIQFCAFIVGGELRKNKNIRCAFGINDMSDIKTRHIDFSSGDFDIVNPNSGTAPIFLSQRDADITIDIYRRMPILHKDGENPLYKVKYSAMFHMSGDSDKFHTAADLEKSKCYRIIPANYQCKKDTYLRLYQGRMINFFNHRANSVKVAKGRRRNPYVGVASTLEQLQSTSYFCEPQYWVEESLTKLPEELGWFIGFRNVARAGDKRTCIPSLMPRAGAAHSLPVLIPPLPQKPQKATQKALAQWRKKYEQTIADYKTDAPLLVANMSSFVFDFVVRKKMQGANLTMHILHQLPVVPPADYQKKAGKQTIGEFVRERVLQLAYTADDMKEFAKDMAHKGKPFIWDENNRAHLRAQLDALYFLLYGITNDDAKYIMDSFTNIKEEDEKQHNGGYFTRDLILRYLNAYQNKEWHPNIAPPTYNN